MISVIVRTGRDDFIFSRLLFVGSAIIFFIYNRSYKHQQRKNGTDEKSGVKIAFVRNEPQKPRTYRTADVTAESKNAEHKSPSVFKTGGSERIGSRPGKTHREAC